MEPWGMTAYRLAKGLGMQQIAVSQILKGKRRVTAETALRLSRFLGMKPDTWLRLQAAYDLEEAQRHLGDRLDFIERYQPPDCEAAAGEAAEVPAEEQATAAVA
jgi:addiction module HigA family antidote